MNLLTKILAPLIASVVVYAALFIVFKKPVTLGRISENYDLKLEYAKEAGPAKKIVILGGSSGMFSLSCEEFERRLGPRCVNASMAVGLGIDFLLEKGKEFVNPGDVVILPLEYGFYGLSKDEVVYAVQGNNYIYQYERGYLSRLGPEKLLASVFSFDFQYLVSSVMETGAAAMVGERKHLNKMNRNGDVVNHTRERGEAYGKFILSARQMEPSGWLLINEEPFYSELVIKDFIKWCNERGVLVLGLLPTAFDDAPLYWRMEKRIRAVYEKNGGGYIHLKNLAQYPRDCFYDSPYHLNRECQLEHTRLVADAIQEAGL